MARPAFLRNITHRILWTVTLIGSVGLAIYWIALREPAADWRILVLGLLLSIALGWWAFIAMATGLVLALCSWFLAPVEGLERSQIAEEVLAFTALGLGWGALLRGLLVSSKPLLPPANLPEHPPRHEDPFANLATPRHPLPTAPRPQPARPPSLPQPVLEAPPSNPGHQEPVSLPAPGAPETSMDGFVMPGLVTAPISQPPPFAPLPPERPATPPPMRPLVAPVAPPARLPEPVVAVPLAAPLYTQEVDLGDFKAFVASQQALSQPSDSQVDALPVNRVSGRSSELRAPLAPPPPPGLESNSSIGGDPSSSPPDPSLRRSAAMSRPETVPGAPYEAVLEWYNQFTWAPWKPEELEKRYYRHGQKVGWDTLALQDLVRCWKIWQQGPKPSNAPEGYTNLWELEGFLRCETLGLLRKRGYPDLNLLSRGERSDAWMAVYRETRGRVRGGSPVLRPMPDELVAFDAERSLSGRPDALVEVAGECDVVAFVTPMSPDEPMTWSGVYAAAQHKLAERLGVVVTPTPVVMRQMMPIWDDRRQPRLHEVEDRATEVRRLDVALERFLRLRDGSSQARPQTRPTVCNGCGSRHFCPNYSGTRIRLELGEPPPILRKFLQ